jgi:hypothetical protein
MRFLLLGSLILTACSFQLGSSTSGEDGHAKFEYASCFFGCSVDQAMMTGTAESIRVTSSVDIPPVTARSTDSSVVSVGEATRECCLPKGSCRTLVSTEACASGETATLTVHVVANAPGSAELVLDHEGAVFDAVALTVAQPESLVISCNGTAAITLAKDGDCGLAWTAKDAHGATLMASTGVMMTTSDPTVADFSSGLLGTKSSTVTATQGLFGTSLVAHSAGVTTIDASASNATSQLVVHVTP